VLVVQEVAAAHNQGAVIQFLPRLPQQVAAVVVTVVHRGQQVLAVQEAEHLD